MTEGTHESALSFTATQASLTRSQLLRAGRNDVAPRHALWREGDHPRIKGHVNRATRIADARLAVNEAFPRDLKFASINLT